ncbi:spore germination protein GerPC [Halobacillus litoralis]|uniref:spore germination protein GerPC n=1 Tax=Halobacillus litoralis TaxID=45668 RepID=UPI001CD3EAB0|nr:spore germination protein GerPC [Halobacillus litoralis]MCA0969633.1 spore germination protein GerPC [Halobacillus litoralis]
MNYYGWQSYIQQMMNQIERQQQLIQQLQQQIDDLSSNEKPQTVIEKIEYHFDQLKIETLEGTLQIGLTPNGSDVQELTDLYGSQQPKPAKPMLHSLQEYMTNDIPMWMNQYTRDHDIPINEEHKERVLTDVKRQLPERVNLYKEKNPDADETALLHQIQTEIQRSMAAYFDSLKGDD